VVRDAILADSFSCAKGRRIASRHIHALGRGDKGSGSLVLAGEGRAAMPARGKKSPAKRRGKTDSLEISQRGKACIYTKFMERRKRKMNKNLTLAECNLCKNVEGRRKSDNIQRPNET
jgi:hypothetical protein